jgi:hypothetical protein
VRGGPHFVLELPECPSGHALVRALAEGQTVASGVKAEVGAYGRLGNVGDGNIIQERSGMRGGVATAVPPLKGRATARCGGERGAVMEGVSKLKNPSLRIPRILRLVTTSRRMYNFHD